jgi:hypothetical protein
VFPPLHAWNAPIDQLPVDRRSAAYLESIGASRNLHPDFGAEGSIPFNIVPRDQPTITVRFIEGEAESDHEPYPIPDNPLKEAGSDGHILILRQGDCRLFEMLDAGRNAQGQWQAYSGAVFDLTGYALRPDGWTSADAAGLAILPGLLRWEEIEAGEIKHAIRFTAPRTTRAYVWPARHFASSSNDPNLPPMGQRFRLRADFDISAFSERMQVVLRAFKRYGIILADNGGAWFVNGVPSPNWPDAFIAEFKRIPASAMEAVDVSPLIEDVNSGRARRSTNRNEVSFSDRPQFDARLGSVQSITLRGNVAQSTVTGSQDGQILTFVICQDEGGGWDFRWPANVRGGMETGRAANTCSVQSFVTQGPLLLATGPGMRELDSKQR